jgi:hypothetical protein
VNGNEHRPNFDVGATPSEKAVPMAHENRKAVDSLRY